jgi:hypothetical protein
MKLRFPQGGAALAGVDISPGGRDLQKLRDLEPAPG